jgi:hypothetical protein
MQVVVTAGDELLIRRGVALSHHMKTRWPWIGLIVTSAHAMLTEDDLPRGGRFLAKPYHHPHVIEQVRELAEVA